MFLAITCLQYRVLPSVKHRKHFPVLEGILTFLTLPFSIWVTLLISFRFLFLLKAVIGCSGNISHRFLLVWKLFQFLWTALSFGKNQLQLYVNVMHLDLAVPNLFLAVGRILQAYQLFLIAHQQVSGRNLFSQITT